MENEFVVRRDQDSVATDRGLFLVERHAETVAYLCRVRVLLVRTLLIAYKRGMETTKMSPSEETQEISLSATAKRTLVVYGVILAVSIFLYLGYLLSSVILQLIVALIAAIALEPMVQFFMRRKLSRTWSVVLTVGVALLGALIVVGLIATPFITQGTHLIENAPQIVTQLTQNTQFHFLNEQYHLVDRVKELSQTQAGQIAGVGVPLLGVAKNIVGGISSFAIIVVLTFLLLLQGPDIWDRTLGLMSHRVAATAKKIAEKTSKAVGGFVTGNLLISLIAGTVALITLLILDVPYAFALAALLAIFDLIPMIGAALGTIVVGLVALTQGVWVALIVVAVLLIYQVVEGHFIQPLVYSRAVSLSPLLIILVSVVGAELGGIPGVLLAIPAAAVIQIFVSEIIEVTKVQRGVRT